MCTRPPKAPINNVLPLRTALPSFGAGPKAGPGVLNNSFFKSVPLHTAHWCVRTLARPTPGTVTLIDGVHGTFFV